MVNTPITLLVKDKCSSLVVLSQINSTMQRYYITNKININNGEIKIDKNSSNMKFNYIIPHN